MIDRQEFLARRRSGIGGSDIAAVCGLSPWRSPLDVYFDKIGETPEPEEPAPKGPRAALYWGTVLEDVIARAYMEWTGHRVVRYSRLLRNPAAPWEIGDIDRLVIDDGAKIAAKPRGEIICKRGLEIKTSRMRGEEWGEEGTDQIPVWYFAQVQWYMALAPSIEVFDVVVLFGGSDLALYTVPRNDTTIGQLRRAGAFFWHENVEKRIPPEASNYAEEVMLHPEAKFSEVVVTEEQEAVIDAWEEATAERKAAEKHEDDLKLAVAKIAADGEIIKNVFGEVRATFKTTKNGGRRLLAK